MAASAGLTQGNVYAQLHGMVQSIEQLKQTNKLQTERINALTFSDPALKEKALGSLGLQATTIARLKGILEGVLNSPFREQQQFLRDNPNFTGAAAAQAPHPAPSAPPAHAVYGSGSGAGSRYSSYSDSEKGSKSPPSDSSLSLSSGSEGEREGEPDDDPSAYSPPAAASGVAQVPGAFPMTAYTAASDTKGSAFDPIRDGAASGFSSILAAMDVINTKVIPHVTGVKSLDSTSDAVAICKATRAATKYASSYPPPVSTQAQTEIFRANGILRQHASTLKSTPPTQVLSMR